MVKCKAIRNFVGQKNDGGFEKDGTKMELPQERFDVLKSLGYVKELKAPKETKELKTDKATK